MKGNIEIYQSENKEVQIEVNFENESVWLSQEQMAALFERDRTVIGRHIKNIFKEEEIIEAEVCANFAHTTRHGAIEGKTQQQSRKNYNLDVIISVGYRVKSKQGTQFRIWATSKLKELMVQGYTINQKRLAQKEQEIKMLKTGIQIIGRAIEQKAEEQGFDWLDTKTQDINDPVEVFAGIF